MIESDLPVCVAALYKFTGIDDCAKLRKALMSLCRAQDVKGTLLLAQEGINGTIAGSDDGIRQVLDHIRRVIGGADLEVKFSRASATPFHRLKVRIKREIVTMGQPQLDHVRHAGRYVSATDWNGLIRDPSTIIIDTRNDYEVAIGSFAGAINPQTRSFREFPEWFNTQHERLLGGLASKVAMFCTGGIRCEKATAFLKTQGVEDVYHLQGGILKYLEEVPQEQSLWHGECYVFDERVSVGHGLKRGTYTVCRGCRRPVSENDRGSELYEVGVGCPACHAERSDAQRARYRERHRQECMAVARGGFHVGMPPASRHARGG